MGTALVVSLLFGALGEDSSKAKEPPAKKELFAQEDWYKGQKGEERAFVGVVERGGRPEGVVGFGRNNPYRLVMEEKVK